LFTAGVDDALGEGHFSLILGDNGVAGSRSRGDQLDAANNDAAVRAVALTRST
jgi:hypothetical protein